MNAIFTIYQTSDDGNFQISTKEENAGDMAFILNCQPAVYRFLLKIDNKIVTWKDRGWIKMNKMMLRESENETQQQSDTASAE